MDPKLIANIPISAVCLTIVAGANGYVHINPYIIFSGWLIFSLSMIFGVASSVMGWGYKSNLNTDKTGKRLAKDVLIPLTLLLPFFFIPIASILWDDTHSTSKSELLGIILMCTLLAYLNGIFRNKVFAYFTPLDKDVPIKFTELRKYIRWYTWLLFATILLILTLVIASMFRA